MKFLLKFLLLGAALLLLTDARRPAGFDEKNLAVRWQLVGNRYQGGDNTLSAFTLTNKGKTSFPASGWTLYFNSSREIGEARPGSGVTFSHVNGDIYAMRPDASFHALRPGASARIEYFSYDVLINYTAVPSGLYIVWDQEPGAGYSLSNYTVEPLNNTMPDQVTPGKIYRQNSLIQDLPGSQVPKIFPTPLIYSDLYGVFHLDKNVTIQSDSAFRAEADYLSAELTRLLGSPVPVRYDQGPARIVLQKTTMKNEAYRLMVQPGRIEISAGSGAGIFYGIQSLWSLAPPELWHGNAAEGFDIPAVEVEDEPRFAYRSLMLDVARNFKPQQELFRVLDLMALYKMNVLHLHFSDDEGWRIEIPGLPELTEVGARRGHSADGRGVLPPSYGAGPVPGRSQGSGYYSRKEFIALLRYAQQRHISVVPEVEAPGHGRAAIKAMQARYERLMRQGDRAGATEYLLSDPDDRSTYSSAQRWTDNVMCVALPSVYRFAEKVTDELIAMYREANAPLTTIHFGGDEVPAGAWAGSPLCAALVGKDPSVHEINDLWYYFYGRINTMLQSKGLFLSAWEEAGMRKTVLDGHPTLIVNSRMANDNIQLHVWNNVAGWGSEDLPYRLANAGYKVVLSPVSNNYLDLACFKHPDEPGYYWGGFQDIDKPFYFIPFDYYKNAAEDPDGNPLDPSVFNCKERLTDFGRSNIVGIQGLLWAENLRSVDQMEYLLLPKILGVAERAWAKDPAWAQATDKAAGEREYARAWSVFVQQVGRRELPRLDYFAGGFAYRIPWPGAIAQNGLVKANIQFPGLALRYTTDGSDPSPGSTLYNGPIAARGTIKIRAFDTRGRGSLTTTVENP